MVVIAFEGLAADETKQSSEEDFREHPRRDSQVTFAY
jgi:hypothetical protein